MTNKTPSLLQEGLSEVVVSQGQPVTFMFQCSSESTNVSIYLQSTKIILNHIKQNKIKNRLGPQMGDSMSLTDLLKGLGGPNKLPLVLRIAPALLDPFLFSTS